MLTILTLNRSRIVYRLGSSCPRALVHLPHDLRGQRRENEDVLYKLWIVETFEQSLLTHSCIKEGNGIRSRREYRAQLVLAGSNFRRLSFSVISLSITHMELVGHQIDSESPLTTLSSLSACSSAPAAPSLYPSLVFAPSVADTWPHFCSRQSSAPSPLAARTQFSSVHWYDWLSSLRYLVSCTSL